MRASLFVRLAVALVAVTLLSPVRTLRLAAQVGTPLAMPDAGGVALLGRGMPSAAPGQTLRLLRVSFAPEPAPTFHTHPGAELIVVESGTLGFTVALGQAQVTRAAGPGTPPAEEAAPLGTEVTLRPGDAVFTDAGTVHGPRAIGDEPAVVLVAQLVAADQPPIRDVTAEGTPIP